MGMPKPLLTWGEETLIQYQVRQLREAGAEPVIVVLGHGPEEIAPLVAGSDVVVNALWSEGPASSLRRGAEALPESTAAVVVLGVDQPRPAYVLAALLDAHAIAGALISVPVFGGKRGHPVVLDASLVPELLRVDEDTLGLRGVLERHAEGVQEVAMDSPVVLMDLNTVEEYKEALRFFG